MCKRTCVISSSSCKTASSSSWVKLPLKRSSISYGMNNELRPYCDLQSCCQIKTCWWQNKTCFSTWYQQHLPSGIRFLPWFHPLFSQHLLLTLSTIKQKTWWWSYTTGVLLKHLVTECSVVSSFAWQSDLDCIKNGKMLYLTYTPNHWTALFNFSTTGFSHAVRYVLEWIVYMYVV